MADTTLPDVVVTAKREYVDLRSSEQFSVKAITFIIDGYPVEFSGVFEELNLFDSMVMPCMSGSIVVRDAQSLCEKLKFSGNEKLYINIDKGVQNMDSLSFEKTFTIDSLSPRYNVNQTSEVYTIHFTSTELLLSQQQKVNQSYKGKYSDMVTSILKNYLNVKESPELGSIYPSSGTQNITIPNLTPFEAINWITRRAISDKGVPEFIFHENIQGFNFMPLSAWYSYDSLFTIQTGIKNVLDDHGTEMLTARDYEIVSQFNLLDAVSDGVYASKFVGFDPLTRTINTRYNKTFEDVYSKTNHTNGDKSKNVFNPMAAKLTPSSTKPFSKMYDSKVVLYPYETPRLTSEYVKKNGVKTLNTINSPETYLIERRSILANLFQKRIKFTMPGNFGLFSAGMVGVAMRKRGVTDNQDILDMSLTGRYIIVSARHTIRYDKHETLIEVASDSSLMG